MIIGVCASDTTSSSASAFGVVFGPTITSTFCSVVSLRTLRTALVASEPSSRMKYSTFWPAISFGHSSIAFLVGAPIAAAGPVVEMLTPILIWANADELPKASASRESAGKAAQGSKLHVVLRGEK